MSDTPDLSTTTASSSTEENLIRAKSTSEWPQPRDVAEEMALTGTHLAQVKDAIGAVIFGQERVIELSLVTLLAGGHGLLIGVPGLAKTRLVSALGMVLGLQTKRVQFTPDLMPSDILGSEVLEEGSTGQRSFRFIKGPVFAQLLMADEINRASPRTQSALLQAMQEQQVSVAGHNYTLPEPFHVLATQNPLEQEGTYPLPEAQLDRFLMQIDIGFPDLDAEKQIILTTTGEAETQVREVISQSQFRQAQMLARKLPVSDQVVDAVLEIVRSARPETARDEAIRKQLAWGPGPRASQALMLAARARAVLHGRFAPSLDDVVELAPPILKHRMALNFAARADGVTVEELIDRVLAPFQ